MSGSQNPYRMTVRHRGTVPRDDFLIPTSRAESMLSAARPISR